MHGLTSANKGAKSAPVVVSALGWRPDRTVEPYAVLTLACRGPLRAMRSSALLLGRIASGGCWRGDATGRAVFAR
jgi:hypothetical protein